ncbi:MAG: fumarate hydratase [Bacteroidetes bacterium]|nr:MAG: fumarate hydratase [Bacteroidota bacterium]
MIYAAITGDIIAFTSLTIEGRKELERQIPRLFADLRTELGAYVRQSQGDYLECVLKDPSGALRAALLIKSFFKAVSLKKPEHYEPSNRSESFLRHRIRLAISLGPLSRFDEEKGIVDGEAIYEAGRSLSAHSTYDKSRIVIKESMQLLHHDIKRFGAFDPLLALLDVLLSQATSKQCAVLYYRLLGKNEDDIAAKLRVSQPVVNRQSKSVGWHAIERSLQYFEAQTRKTTIRK